MGLFHAPNLVVDGLVMALDPASLKSYAGTGSSFYDLSGNTNNGTLLNGPVYSTNLSGYFTFDGTNDYINVAHSSSLNIADNFTVSFWSKQKTNTAQVPLSKYQSGVRGWVFVYNNTANLMSFDGRNQTADGYKNAESSVTAPLGVWNHYTGVKSGVNMTIYQNGVATGSTTWSSAGDMTSSVSLTIGSLNGAFYSTCDVGQILYYNRVLTDDEIMQNYDAIKNKYIYSVPIVTSGLILNYDAGSILSYPGSGSTWTDLSSSARHGTITEAVYGGTGSTGYFAFDGSNDVVTSSTFTPNVTNKTLAGWVKLSSTAQTGGGLITLEVSGGASFDSIVYNETSNGWGFGSNSYARTAWSGISETSTSTWVYIAATYSDNNYKLYRNGILILNTTSFATYNFNAAGNALVGKRHTGGSGAHLAGQISHAAIYNRALTSTEVLQNFNAMKGRYGY
jgi:hypothetical protein